MLASEQTLLKQPFIHQYFKSHPVLNRKRWKKINHIFRSRLLLPTQHKFLLFVNTYVHGVTPWLIIRAYTNTKDWITDGVLDLNTFNTISWRISLCFLPSTLSKRITAKLPAYIDADSKDFSLGILRSNLTSCTTISVNLAFLAKRC